VRTFDIRFERSLGLAGLFEAPANRLGWKGSGRLSVDAQGISIAVKRGLLSLFLRRSRRFSADSLTEAYREGDSLRLVFGGHECRESLAVWTKGGAAAEIVKLLPTLRTVELEHSTDSGRGYRFDRRTAVSLLILAGMLAAGISLLLRQLVDPGSEMTSPVNSSSINASRPAVELGSDPKMPGAHGVDPARADTSRKVRDRGMKTARDIPAAAGQGVTPTANSETIPSAVAGLPSSDVPGEVPTSTYGNYGDVIATLRRDYRDLRGATSADVLVALETRWWEVTAAIYVSTPGADYRPGVCDVLAISRAWRNHLYFYAESLRTGDQSLMTLAQSQLELAEELGKDFIF
jgi:hypothetical protein